MCIACSTSTNERIKRRRKKQRELVEFRQIVTAHEAAGDRARDHHLFDAAAQHYQEALGVEAIVPVDFQRLVEKLDSVSFFTNDPSAATTWRGRVLNSYLGNAENAGKTVEIFLAIAAQMWIDSKTQESLALLGEAVRIAGTHGTSRLHQFATLRLASHLITLGRFDDASRYLNALENIESTDDLDIRRSYYRRRGCIAAMQGAKAAAYEDFERAAQCAKDISSFSGLTVVLQDYATIATSLGDIEHARAICEQALLVVRRNHMGWQVPLTCMDYANILARMGRYTEAHAYLLEALSSDAHAPILDEYFSLVGIPIALHLNDEATLVKCA